MMDRIANVSSMFLIIIVSLTGAIRRQDCTFDDNFCLWKEDKGWKISADKANLGMYASMAVPQGCIPHTAHRLWTTVHAMQGPVCISFLYFLNGSDNRLNLYLKIQDDEGLILEARSNSNWSIVSTLVNESFPTFTLEFAMYPGPSCLGEAGLKNVSVVTGQCPGLNALQTTCSTIIRKTTSPHPGIPEFQTTSSTDLLQETNYTTIPVAAIIGSVVGSLVFVMVLAIVAVCIFRKKQCSKERNAVNTIQLPSYEILEHGGNTVDYLHVVHSSNPSSTQHSNVPFPHNITSNNDNEYDYVT